MSDFTGADAEGTDPDLIAGTPSTEIPEDGDTAGGDAAEGAAEGAAGEDTEDQPDVLEQPDTAPFDDPR